MRSFSLLVKPASADCNLRCDYCFYLGHAQFYPETARHRMSDEVLEKTIAGFLATDQPEHAFGWQGGEPTILGLDFFRRVTDLQKKHGRGGAVVANGLQTNATLIDDAFARHLAEYRFLVGVSLDGPPEIHDRHRRNAAGRPSHGEVLGGIRALARAGVEFNILTLVSDANVRRGRDVYRYLRDAGFLYHQYIPCVEFDPAGALRSFAVRGEEWGEFLCAVFDEWIGPDARRVSVRLFDSILHRLVAGGTNVCHMATDCRQYFVVEYGGDVFPCDFHVDRTLLLGNVARDSWDSLLRSPVYAEFGARKSAWNEACAACENLALCAGDCLKHRFGSLQNPRALSALCAGWKMFFAHSHAGFARLAAGLRRELTSAAPSERIAPRGARPGRNDPCPCGSGRKFKNCCGRR